MEKQGSTQRKYLLLVCLITFYNLVGIAALMTTHKIVHIAFLKIDIIGPSIFFPLLFQSLDVITEIYGDKIAKFSLYQHYVFLYLFIALTFLVISLPSPQWFNMQSDYEKVFYPILPLLTGSLVGVLVSSFLNIYYLSKWKFLTHGKYFWLRSLITTSASLIIYTTIVDFGGLFLSFSNSHLIKLTEINVLSNVILTIVFVNFSALIVKILKRHVKIDIKQPSWNPFN